MIPTVNDLKSSLMIHRFGDLFNPPALTNFVGAVQASRDITGISSLNFPPFGTADTTTAGLFLNGRYFPSLNCPVSYCWRPDKIIREAEYQGLFLKSETVMLTGRNGVIIRLTVENRSGNAREIKIKFGLAGSITFAPDKWANFMPPSESDNKVIVDNLRSAAIFMARHSQAVQIQGIDQQADSVTPVGIEKIFRLAPGETQTVCYITVIGSDEKEVCGIYDKLSAQPEREILKTEQDWNAELKAVFTPGNDRYSGYLPTLVTDDQDILRLYYTGILSVIYFKRDNPYSKYGRAYDTLVPKYWQTVTFIWDYHLSQIVHALLDPDVMQKYLERWMLMDTHKHFGTEYLTDKPVGPWYSVNDFAMLSMSRYFLTWNGRREWLQKAILDPKQPASSKKVIDYFRKYADSWNYFKSGYGLADYGGINNLLECVSTYIHEVASLNAGNVHNLRFMADILELTGDPKTAAHYRNEAVSLLPELLKLYKSGKGYWRARFPDGKMVDVRHIYDFITILNNISGDLSDTQKSEMFQFFDRELKTKTWLRAISPFDDNAMFSVRPDHQWNGAYPAWPAQAATALYKIGRGKEAFQWLKGVAKSANQGPFGQAHFVESAVKTEDGGAAKSPPEPPFMCDWAVSGGGAFVNVIIESIFGVNATLETISAKPDFQDFDAKAELLNLRFQGKRYAVDKSGLKEMGNE
ncbi:MAG: hypothetical protein J7L22_07150 [Candidatus Marinimicrobia bacterium]|nr:hypothetical protein [Candidatus Neomarinimicrobiota bacterium]